MSIALPPSRREEIIQRIAMLAPAGNACAPGALAQLKQATRELTALLAAEGQLEENPTTLAMERTVDLHHAAAVKRVKDQRILVTGGAGCVGTRLITLLETLGAAEIAIVDIAPGHHPDRIGITNTVVRHYAVDVRDAHALHEVFTQCRPQVVFHLASIREPGRAEAVVREAIGTNVFGTRNVITACQLHGVEDAVYSSTGKCFAYVSDHVYASSKKLAEQQWVAAARRAPRTRFRTARFTHIMENGVLAQDIHDGIANGLVALHGPDRYFNIQNLRQATHLLLNTLALADETPADGFWSAVDLGWPVNTLELALFQIRHSRADAAVCFKGVPKGYDEAFFRGQFCWGGDTPYHPLINALEAPSGFGDPTGTMVGARVHPFSEATLHHQLQLLENALGDERLGIEEVKGALTSAVGHMASAVFAKADVHQLLNVLWWGAAPAWAGDQASEARRFFHVIGRLAQSLLDKLESAPDVLSPQERQRLEEIAETLAKVPELARHSRRLQQMLDAPASCAVGRVLTDQTTMLRALREALVAHPPGAVTT